jgi:hypothetical protein
MNTREVIAHLEESASCEDFVARAADLMDELSRSPQAFDAVEPILRFMELHPELDLGTPGPLVHFVERFYGHGYEQKLVESIDRKPIGHTVWMLNRIINGTKGADERRHLIEILERARDNPKTEEGARDLASRFLTRLALE